MFGFSDPNFFKPKIYILFRPNLFFLQNIFGPKIWDSNLGGQKSSKIWEPKMFGPTIYLFGPKIILANKILFDLKIFIRLRNVKKVSWISLKGFSKLSGLRLEGTKKYNGSNISLTTNVFPFNFLFLLLWIIISLKTFIFNPKFFWTKHLLGPIFCWS